MHISDLLFWRLLSLVVMVSTPLLGIGVFQLARRLREWLRSLRLDREHASPLPIPQSRA